MADKRLVILKKANKLFKQNKNDSALKEYKKVLTIKPDDMEVRRIIGDIELRLKNIKGAVDQFEWMADHYLNEGFFTKAIAMYKRITRLDPSYEKAFFRLAELYTRQGLIIEAKQIYLEMAENFKRTNNQKKSLDMYKKILEFDKKNIKMRLILAENYLRENLVNEALNEYLITADILLSKKDFKKVEEILIPVIKNIKSSKIVEKVVFAYTAEGDDDKAIQLLKEFGPDLYKDINLLKMLGELYFKKNMIDDAESIFKKVTEVDPKETEILLKLGKVYLQREEYDKTFNLFLPIIDKKMSESKAEEASGLLRIIIASNNFYLPALKKLASIFRATKDINSLIPLNESLIPIYEERKMKKELREVLEELIKISDSPFNYEEKLASMDKRGYDKNGLEDSSEKIKKEREGELISHLLRKADDNVKLGEYEIAVESLNNARMEYPQNIEIKLKLFKIYKDRNEVNPAVNIAKELLTLYKLQNDNDKYEKLLDELSLMAPDDEQVMELGGEEKTNIDIDFEKSDIIDQLNDIENTGMQEIDLSVKSTPQSNEMIVLSDKDSIVIDKEEKDANYKSISGYLSEIDFYINDGYYEDAENLAEELLDKFPDNKNILERIDKLKRARQEKIDNFDMGNDEIEIDLGSGDYEVTKGSVGIKEDQGLELQIESNSHNEQPLSNSSTFKENPDYQIKINGGSTSSIIDENSKSDVDSVILEFDESKILNESKNKKDDKKSESVSSFDFENIITGDIELNNFEEPEISESKLEIDDLPLPEEKLPEKTEFSEISDMKYEIEMEEIDSFDDMEIEAIDESIITTSPSVKRKEIKEEMGLSSSNVLLSLDNAFEEEISENDGEKTDSPFEEIDKFDLLLENEEELLKDEVSFPETISYLEIEKNITEELKAFDFWINELQKQRTSTVEKNMMEIFDEFKKGVDEKIGKDDFETRYNLGIAYKEMGLIEEAIHEFLISSKNPKKHFDSAGLLGMCFREKGMIDDAIEWFSKALKTTGRKEGEYLAVKYELITSYKVKEDYETCLKLSNEISKDNPDFRDIKELKKFFESKLQK